MSGLADFARGAGRVGSTLAEVGLPLVGLAAEGQAGMAAGNQLASLVPGTEQHKQRQFQINQQADARAQQIANGALRGANVLLTDQLQELRTSVNMGLNDASDAEILATQNGRQAIGINAINALLTREGRGDDELRAAGIIAKQAFGAEFDPKTMSFRYQGKTYDLSDVEQAQRILGTVQEYAMGKTVNGVLADGLKLAADKDFGAAQQALLMNEFTTLGLDKGEAFAASQQVMGGIPEDIRTAHRIATGWKQFLDDEAAENTPGYEDKGARLLQEFQNLPGVTLVGDPQAEIAASARKVRVQPGSDIARLLGIAGAGPHTDPDVGLMSATGLADKIEQRMNLRARARMYYQAHHESDKDLYYRVARSKDGRKAINDFKAYITGMGGLPGMEDEMGEITMSDATFAEFRRFIEHHFPNIAQGEKEVSVNDTGSFREETKAESATTTYGKVMQRAERMDANLDTSNVGWNNVPGFTIPGVNIEPADIGNGRE